MRKILIALAVFMLLLIGISLDAPTAKFLFVLGSDGIVDIAQSNLGLQILFLTLFIGVIIGYNRINSKYKTSLIIVSLLMCLLSRRTTAYCPYPEEHLITGWFCIKTNEISLCPDFRTTDCEQESYYKTYIERLPFWRIRIRNTQQDAIIFVGPFTWQKTLDLLSEKFPYNKPRKIE